MRSPYLTIMSNAAIKAGKVLLRDLGEVDQLQVSRKGVANFVTKTDLKVEKMLVTELKKAKPDIGFLLEEGGEIKGNDDSQRWIIDPLDGTNNFIHALPYFCISIALERTTRGLTETVFGVVYDPVHNDVFSAEKYRGSMLNNRRINVSGRDNLEQAMIIAGNSRFSGDPKPFEMFRKVGSASTTLRTTGSAALDLAYVAAGRYDACWFSSLQPWDMAAGILLVEEAGGTATRLDGKPATPYGKSLLAGSKSMHGQVMKLLAA